MKWGNKLIKKKVKDYPLPLCRPVPGVQRGDHSVQEGGGGGEHHAAQAQHGQVRHHLDSHYHHYHHHHHHHDHLGQEAEQGRGEGAAAAAHPRHAPEAGVGQ